jgi:hypothetical protein
MRLLLSQIMHTEREPRGGTLDAAWPRTPVAHLAFETDIFFTIDC